MPGSYSLNDIVQMTATFTNLSGANVDPTTVTVTVKKPNGVEVTPSVTHAGTGVYTAQVTVDTPGTWLWRAYGTGAAQAQQDGMFIVVPNTF